MPHRHPLPPSTSPRRSLQLSRPGLTKDFQRLPLSAKSDTRRTAHSWSASKDERGRHASRSSRSSSEQGRLDQARRSREPTRLQLPNLTLMTSPWYRTQAVPFSLPVCTLFSRDGCEWSRPTVGTASGNLRAPMTPRRNRS